MGSLKGRGQVVVKAQSTAAAKREYDVQKKLAGLPGFVQFECFFTCQGDPEALQAQSNLCTAVGNSMGVIVMPYYSSGSLEDRLKRNTDKLKLVDIVQIIIRVVQSLYHAFTKTGFTHGDMFTKNVLIGTEADITDFEKSSFDKSAARFWLDLDDFINDVYRYIDPAAQAQLDNICRSEITMARAFSKVPNDNNIQALVNKLHAIV